MTITTTTTIPTPQRVPQAARDRARILVNAVPWHRLLSVQTPSDVLNACTLDQTEDIYDDLLRTFAAAWQVPTILEAIAFDAKIAACLPPEVREEYRAFGDHEGATKNAHQEAGFLLGLEVGLRLVDMVAHRSGAGLDGPRTPVMQAVLADAQIVEEWGDPAAARAFRNRVRGVLQATERERDGNGGVGQDQPGHPDALLCRTLGVLREPPAPGQPSIDDVVTTLDERMTDLRAAAGLDTVETDLDRALEALPADVREGVQALADQYAVGHRKLGYALGLAVGART